jgi:CheY-like chemotaxis protein
MPNKKILIIEDHPGLRSLLTDLFTLNGYQVTAVTDGVGGLEKAETGGYDVIICDIKMPAMDGITFLKALREHPPKVANGPIIMYSNFAYEYSKDEVLGLGAADFIAKDTIASGELVERVNHLINNPNKQTDTAQAGIQ